MDPVEVRISVRPQAGRGLLVVTMVLVTAMGVFVAVSVADQVLKGEFPLRGLLYAGFLVWMCFTAVRSYREERGLDPLRLVVGPGGITRAGGRAIPWSEIDAVRYRPPRPPLSWIGRSGSVAVVQQSQTRFAARAGVRPEATRISASQLDHSAVEIMDAIALHAPEPLRARLPAPWGARDGSSPRAGTRSAP
ncbi:hypothetical protein [Auraticoccus monumenti]|uniref:PH domain-containing protein n=1 Tax=Auraticoccus monumenti TaxID=675864 RepID=A0A1G6SDB9_9ACTN|nr:hypothetical protein [Auraticoccus monumenti]SDD14147.1 hypothetical protein SAMN04489747_0278 [Auraticoccus monumenti]